MQKKAIVISFVLAVLIWVGYMVSRHLGQSTERAETNQEIYQGLMDIAKKSPNAGLVHVARILNRYNKDKGVYPESLLGLYPEYLPSEPYIREIQWDYERSGESNFSLKKTITTTAGTQRTMLIHKDLRIASVGSTTVARVDNETEEGADVVSEEELGVMMASPAPISESKEVVASDAEGGETGETESGEVEEEVSNQMITTAPEIVSVVKEGIAPGIDPKLGNAYLVWKDENGRLGFGNVDYPSSYRLSVYSNGMYQNIRHPAPLEQKPELSESIGHAKTKDEIAKSLGKQTLVWRNKDGTLGFGNVDYPKGDNVSSINVDGKWEEKRKTQP